MGKSTKNNSQKKLRILTSASGIYSNTLCGCRGGGDRRGGGVVNCTVQQTTQKYDVGSFREIDSENLVRIFSKRKGCGAAVDVDSEGNLVWRNQAAETSYGEGVGRIGRIDEDIPCCFNEVDVNNFRFFAISRSKSINLAYN